MLVLKLMRFIAGYVSFTAKGGFPERFINLCRQSKIDLWNLKSENSVISACTDVFGYKRIRNAAKKSGMKVRIVKKYGLSFFLNRHSRRIGLIVGLIVCAAVFMILSTRIWRIEVTGNVRISTEEIIEVFNELGIREGVAVSSIDEWTVEQAAIKKIPEISWVNVNLMGSSAQIEIREVIEQKEIDKSKAPANIVASRDGQIVYLRPFKGTQEKKIGTGVVKGDLLINGIVERLDLSSDVCRADGYVVARTDYEIDVRSEKKKSVKTVTDVKKSYSVNILSFSLPIGKQTENGFENKSNLYVNGVTLPFSLTEKTNFIYDETEIILDDQRALELARLDFFSRAANEFRYKKVEKAEIKEEKNKNGYEIRGSFTCLENIGEVRPFEVVEE